MTTNTKSVLPKTESVLPDGTTCGGANSESSNCRPQDPQSFPDINMRQSVKLGYGCRLDVVVQANARYVIQEFLTNIPMAKMYILENFWVENVHIQDRPFDLFDISIWNQKCLRRCIFGAIGTDGIGIGKYCRIRMTGHYVGAIPSTLVNVKSHELIISPRGYVRE